MLQESSLYKIKSTIINMFNKHNKEVILVNSEYTSQVCSECGTLVYKELTDRTHSCPKCNYVEDRDVNAAKAILKIGKGLLEITQEQIQEYILIKKSIQNSKKNNKLKLELEYC